MPFIQTVFNLAAILIIHLEKFDEICVQIELVGEYNIHLFMPNQCVCWNKIAGIFEIRHLIIAAKNWVIEMVKIVQFMEGLKMWMLKIVLIALEYRQREVLRFLFKQKWQVGEKRSNALHLQATLVLEPHDWY